MCHFGEGLARLPEAPGILTIQDGTYRLEDHWAEGSGSFSASRPGTRDAYSVIRAAQGAHPVLVGSVAPGLIRRAPEKLARGHRPRYTYRYASSHLCAPGLLRVVWGNTRRPGP